MASLTDFNRRLLAVVCLLLAWVAVTIEPFQNVAFALACGGTVQDRAVGGRENTENHIKGTRTDVYVNDFPAAQSRSWRSVAVVRADFEYIAETGWILDSDYDQLAHPYRTTKLAGFQPQTIRALGVNLSKGVNHSFRVHDNNGDQTWSFAYTDNSGNWQALGDLAVSFNNGLSLTEAESRCSTDILFARYRNLNKLPQSNSSWTPYDGLSQYIDANGGIYDFCWLSKTSYDVKDVC